jgi:ABC-2 type transport system permease protein/lipopolysaccharide transport system permease protein
MSINLLLHERPALLLDRRAGLQPPASRTAEALDDLSGGFRRRWIWTKLAYQDIKLRYRGSMLGPFWVTLTNLILILAVGVIYGVMFGVGTAQYVPYVTAGLLIWQFISGMANDACNTFIAAEDVIHQVPLPFSLQAYRVVYRNHLVLAHNAVLIPLVWIVYAVPMNWRLGEIVPGLAVLSLNGLWISLLLGGLSARFRDIPPIVSNGLQLAFFVTPIFWPMSSIGHLKSLLVLNPLFAAIDVVRAPLLGAAPEPTSWPLLLACTALGCVGGLAFFVRFRERIAYWV